MYPDSSFAHPTSSYERPVPLVSIDPDSAPYVSVRFNAAWLPYILGSLQQLVLQSTWKTTDETALNTVQGRAMDLLSMFTTAGEAVGMDVRQSEELPCTLEKSDDGTTWTAWADLQLCPPRLRVGPGGGLQWFDGNSWVDLPNQGDDRTDGESTPPWPTGEVPAGEDGACLAAENIVAFFVSSMTNARQQLTIGGNVAGILGVLTGAAAAFIAPLAFATVGLEIASTLAALGATAITTMLESDDIGHFKCAIAANISSDGSVSAAQYAVVYAQIASTVSSPTNGLIQNWIDGFGPVGLTRQGRAADITTGDCVDCVTAFWEAPSATNRGVLISQEYLGAGRWRGVYETRLRAEGDGTIVDISSLIDPFTVTSITYSLPKDYLGYVNLAGQSLQDVASIPLDTSIRSIFYYRAGSTVVTITIEAEH